MGMKIWRQFWDAMPMHTIQNDSYNFSWNLFGKLDKLELNWNRVNLDNYNGNKAEILQIYIDC
jgi:hypothetical protein